MLRALIVFLLLLVPGLAGAEILPRLQVSIDRDSIVLSDLFDGVPADKAMVAVMRAPRPGQRVVIDAAVLSSIAGANKLGWSAAGRERVTVDRTGQAIPRPVLSDALSRALVTQGFAPSSDVALDNEKLQILVPTGSPLTVGIEQITADPRSNRFQAIVAAPAGDREAERIRVTGRVVQTVEIPVPARIINAGEVMRDHDLVFQRVRADAATRTVLMDPTRIVGRTTRRTLPMGQPIRAGDLIATHLVTKNGIVDVRIFSRGMSLVMQGKALEDGAEGDTVRVLNTRSNKTVQGIVTGPNQVTVSPPGAVAN